MTATYLAGLLSRRVCIHDCGELAADSEAQLGRTLESLYRTVVLIAVVSAVFAAMAWS